MIPKRYNVKNLNRVVDSPSLLIEEVERFFGRFFNRFLYKHYFYAKYGKPVDVMKRDWDNLIILDACRYDLFEQHNYIEGELDYVVSKGSKTYEFCRKNFSDWKFHDTVYVTGNSKLEKIDTGVFYKVYKTYSTDREKFGGAYPKQVLDAAIDAYDHHPDKRLIIHFVQPHAPYIGPNAEMLRERIRENQGVDFIDIRGLKYNIIDNNEENLPHLAAAANAGLISKDELVEVYAENIQIVLEYVDKLISELDGKTVVTSDHGELLGDGRRIHGVHTSWQHPPNIHVRELRLVPWLVVDSDTRRNIQFETPLNDQEVDPEAVKENLRILGYVD